jgi:hypothetical protein
MYLWCSEHIIETISSYAEALLSSCVLVLGPRTKTVSFLVITRKLERPGASHDHVCQQSQHTIGRASIHSADCSALVSNLARTYSQAKASSETTTCSLPPTSPSGVRIKACYLRSSKLGFRTQPRNRYGSPHYCHCSSKDPQHRSRTGSYCCTRRKSGQMDGKRTRRSISITVGPWIQSRADLEHTPPALQVPTLYGAPTSNRGSPMKMAALML